MPNQKYIDCHQKLNKLEKNLKTFKTKMNQKFDDILSPKTIKKKQCKTIKKQCKTIKKPTKTIKKQCKTIKKQSPVKKQSPIKKQSLMKKQSPIKKPSPSFKRQKSIKGIEKLKSIKKLKSPKKIKIKIHHGKSQFQKQNKIGSGFYSHVYRACHMDNLENCDFVIKEQGINNSDNIFEHELLIFEYLQNFSFIPNVHEAGIINKPGEFDIGKVNSIGYIVMDRLDPLPKKNTKKLCAGAIKSIKEIHKIGIVLSDINKNNLLYDKNKKEIMFIDFGLAIVTHGKQNIENYFMYDDMKKVEHAKLMDRAFILYHLAPNNEKLEIMLENLGEILDELQSEFTEKLIHNLDKLVSKIEKYILK